MRALKRVAVSALATLASRCWCGPTGVASWTAEQRREIMAESLGPDLTPADVARKHGISTGQLYTEL